MIRLVVKLGFGLVMLVAAVSLGDPHHMPGTSQAAWEQGTYAVRSPVAPDSTVTSPPRYHNQCSPYTSYFDSPYFDNASVCHPAGITPGQWDMDIGAPVGANVYIDINPAAIDGFPAGSLYRVVAGATHHWDYSANGTYQYFGIHTWDSTIGVWENFAWILVGHINQQQYTTLNQVIAGPTTGHASLVVAKVAPKGSWDPHTHLEVSNYSYFSRPYNWHGPTTTNDTSDSPFCSRPGPTPICDRDNCNARLTATDTTGYIGGTRTSYAELGNPYFNDF